MTARRKVYPGKLYHYEPVGMDLWDGRARCEPGALVRVKNLPGCPPANTMGHAHVVHPETEELFGLVLCNSLVPSAGGWEA